MFKLLAIIIIQALEKKEFYGCHCAGYLIMFALGFRYHHTGPVSGFFALRESLAVIAEKVGDNFTTCCRYFTERHLQLLE